MLPLLREAAKNGSDPVYLPRYKMGNYEDKIYSLADIVPGQTQVMSQAVQKTLENNGGVGIMTGCYDQNLSILSVSNLLLHSTGYTLDTFMKQTKGSFFFYLYTDTENLSLPVLLYIFT